MMIEMSELERPDRPFLAGPEKAYKWDRRHMDMAREGSSLFSFYHAGWLGCISAVAPAHRHVLANALAQAVVRGEVSLEVARASTETYGLGLELERALKLVL